MEGYIKKLEDENKKLVEELGRKEVLISSTPFNNTLYIKFGLDYEFDGTLCGFLASLSYPFVNPYTGNEEDKHLKRYEEKYNPVRQGNDYKWWIVTLLNKVDDDLRSFFNTNIQSFKIDPMTRSSEGIPWINIEPHELRISFSMFDDNMMFDLFAKQKTVAMQQYKRITRWTRFKQLIKGI